MIVQKSQLANCDVHTHFTYLFINFLWNSERMVSLMKCRSCRSNGIENAIHHNHDIQLTAKFEGRTLFLGSCLAQFLNTTSSSHLFVCGCVVYTMRWGAVGEIERGRKGDLPSLYCETTVLLI